MASPSGANALDGRRRGWKEKVMVICSTVERPMVAEPRSGSRWEVVWGRAGRGKEEPTLWNCIDRRIRRRVGGAHRKKAHLRMLGE